MQFPKITSERSNRSFLSFFIKAILILIIIVGSIIMLGKIDFPSPIKEIEKFIPNEKLKIVK
jgi:hypothetical protein